MTEKLEKLCKECERYMEARHFITSSNRSYGEIVEGASEINEKIGELSDQYIELAMKKKNALELIKHCKSCYTGSRVTSAMIISAKGDAIYNRPEELEGEELKKAMEENDRLLEKMREKLLKPQQ